MSMLVKYWCNSHRRPAPKESWGTYADGRIRPCCPPKLVGILLPCYVIDCEEVGIEIEWEADDASRSNKDESPEAKSNAYRNEEVQRGNSS